MLALGVDGVGSPKDHEAFLGVGEAIIILAYRTSFLGCLLIALPFLRLVGLSQKALEELAVLLEMLDGVGVVGALILHELVEVVRLSLLGLLARVISHDDQREVGQSVPIVLVLFAPLRGGGLVLILTLGLIFVLASVEDRSDRLLTRGVVCGDIEQVASGTRL